MLDPVRQMRASSVYGPKLEQMFDLQAPLRELLVSSAALLWQSYRPPDLRERTLDWVGLCNSRHERLFGFRLYREPKPFLDRLEIPKSSGYLDSTALVTANLVELFQGLDRLWAIQIVAMSERIEPQVVDFHKWLWEYANECHTRLVAFPMYTDYRLFQDAWLQTAVPHG